MKFPWMARSAHLEMMALLTRQIAELGHERKVLLDRLAVLGLGGPLFSAEPEAPADPREAADNEADAVASEIEQMLRLRRRPSQLAEALTRKAHRAPRKPQVAWVPAPRTAKEQLDQAEGTRP